jgi:hypothetical protein
MRAAGLSDVAEAEHVEAAAAAGHGGQARHVVAPLVAVERVEQTAIEHGLEQSAQPVQAQRIGERELGVDAARRGLLAGGRYRGISHVDSQYVQTESRQMKGVLTGPAACVENCAGKRAFARQPHDRRLWSSEVPRRVALGVRRIPGLPR